MKNVITATVCKDGKKHRWVLLTTDFDVHTREDREWKWCYHCGCSTEFVNGKRCKGEGQEKYHVMIPNGKNPYSIGKRLMEIEGEYSREEIK